MSQRPLPEATDKVEERCLADVQRVGWHIVHVPPEDDTPGWSFTVGLSRTFGHPEIVSFGIPHEIAHDVLNAVALRVKAGEKFVDGVSITDILEGGDLRARRVALVWYPRFLGLAVWFHQGDEFSCVQLFWPDGDDERGEIWPWSENADDEIKGCQPLLYEDDPIRAHAEALLRTLDEPN